MKLCMDIDFIKAPEAVETPWRSRVIQVNRAQSYLIEGEKDAACVGLQKPTGTSSDKAAQGCTR